MSKAKIIKYLPTTNVSTFTHDQPLNASCAVLTRNFHHLARTVASADVAVDIRMEAKVNIRVIDMTIVPNAIILLVAIHAFLEKRRHVRLSRRRALSVDANSALFLGLIHARLPSFPEIFSASNRLVAFDVAFDGEGVAVNKGHVAVGLPAGVGEVALELRVAAWCSADFDLLAANVHGASTLHCRNVAGF